MDKEQLRRVSLRRARKLKKRGEFVYWHEQLRSFVWTMQSERNKIE